MSRTDLSLVVGRDELTAEARKGRRVAWVATTHYAGHAELAEVVADLVRTQGLPAGTKVDVRFAPPLVQIRRLVALPPVRLAQLTRLVAHQPGRFFRKNGKPLVTDAAWMAGGRKIAVATAVEAPYAEAVLAGARAAGLRVVRIAPEMEPGLPVLSLLPPAERELQQRAARRALWRWGLAAAVAWVACGCFVVGRTFRELARTERALEALRPGVDAVLVARMRQDAAAAAVAAAEAPAKERLGPAMTLSQLVGAMPDSTWLTDVAIDQAGNGVMNGFAPSPASVLARVERSGAVARPRLDRGTVDEVVAGRRVERFTVRFGAGDAQ